MRGRFIREYAASALTREVVHRDRHHQQRLGQCPDERPPLDVIIVDASRKIDVVDGQLGYDVVRRGLTVGRSEGHPGGASPPSDQDPDEAGVLGTGAFCRPYIDGAT